MPSNFGKVVLDNPIDTMGIKATLEGWRTRVHENPTFKTYAPRIAGDNGTLKTALMGAIIGAGLSIMHQGSKQLGPMLGHSAKAFVRWGAIAFVAARAAEWVFDRPKSGPPPKDPPPQAPPGATAVATPDGR